MGNFRSAPAIAAIIGFARHILATRLLRRRLLFHLTVVDLVLLGIGTATISQIPVYPWLMLGYWLGVTTLTAGVFLFALWDLLAVRREERARQRKPPGKYS